MPVQRRRTARWYNWRAPDGDADLESQDFAQFDVPPCAYCGGMLKPDVVFFGENVPRERAAAVREALAKADAMLVVGSSLMVYSGYRFVEDAVLSLKVELEVGEALKTLAKRV